MRTGEVSFPNVMLLLVTAFVWSFASITGNVSQAHEGLRNHGFAGFAQVRLFASQPDRNIAGGDIQSFPVELAAGYSAAARINWKGIDLDVQVLKPDGTKAFASSIPIRAWGPPPVTIVAETPGTYTVEVRTSDQIAVRGEYELLLDTPHIATEQDAKSFLASRLMAEGDRQTTKPSAIQKYLEALEQWSTANSSSGKAFALLRLGNASLAVKEVANAQRYYLELVQLREQLNDPQSLIYTLRQIGLDYRALNSPSVALDFYGRALQLARESSNKRAQASVLYSMGFAHAVMGRMQAALELYNQALPIQREVKDRPGEANTLMAIGGAYNRLGDQTEALNRFQQVRPIFSELKDRFREAVALNNIGLAYDDLGMVQEAKSHYLQAKSQYETILQRDITQCRLGAAGQTLNICNSWANVSDNIGELYNTTGDIQSALDVFRETLAIRKVLDQPQSVGSTLSRICYSHVVQGKVTEALDECNEALTYNRNAEDLRGSGSTLTFLGMIYTALNKPEDAMRSFEEALQLQRQASERRGEGIALNQYGLFYVSRNQPEQALAKYEQALKLWQETRDEDGETITLYNIARLERDRGNLSRALDLNKRALNIIESRRTTLSSEKLLASYFSNKQDHYELQTDLQMLLGQPNKSTTFISEALVTNEHARGRQLLDALSETHVLNIANQDGSNAALAAAIKRRIQLQVSLRERASSRTTLLSASARKEEELSSINQEINKLTDDYDEVESTIRSLSPPYASLTRPTPVTSTEIQLALDQDTLLLEYALGEKRSYVWAVTPDSITGFQLESRDKIEAVANRLVEALTARNRKEPSETFQQEKARVDKADRDYAEAAQQLSKMVIEPVASLLVNRNRLVIVADGALQYVPFAALPISESAAQSTNSQATNRPATLITAHELVSLPSASVLALQRRELANRKAAPLKLAILADPVFDLHDPRVATALARPSRKGSNTSASKAATPSQNPTPKTDNSTLVSALRDVGLNADGTLRRLLFSRTEAADISRLVPPKESLKALDFKASRATAMSGELSKYQYVHFATHGVLSLEHPELSGIALSMVDEKGQKQDGYLRLYEIYNLDLPAELVVLSACETGVGKQIRGEGLIALTRGFMYAGAKRVVASLWKVDDSATAALMAQFYKEMFVSGRTPAAALKEAQKTISQQPRWRSPYYWAGFVLQGEWR